MKQFNYSEHFTDIYLNNRWGAGSGGGSTIENTVEYRDFLEKLIFDKQIKKIIDYGCGDWQSSKLINWGSSSYLGVDCVKHLIDSHKVNFKKNNIDFLFMEKIEDFFSFESDLLILKDVLQHWTNNEIIYFLKNIKNKHKNILIVNCCNQTEEWQELPLRSRPLSCKYYPLKEFGAVLLKTYKIYGGKSEKEISLIQN